MQRGPVARSTTTSSFSRDTSWPYDDAANAIGYTTLTVRIGTGEILGADIEINTANYVVVPDPPAPPMAYDLASILTHEAGHFLGLAHSADDTAVMYAFYKPGSSTLTNDDILGICSIYDPDGIRNTSDEAARGAHVQGLRASASGFRATAGRSTRGGPATAIGSGAGTDRTIDEAGGETLHELRVLDVGFGGHHRAALSSRAVSSRSAR